MSNVLFQHSFWVVRSAGQTTYNYNDAPIRDVVSIGGANDQVTIRFVVCISRSALKWSNDSVPNFLTHRPIIPAHGSFIVTSIGIWRLALQLSSQRASTVPLQLILYQVRVISSSVCCDSHFVLQLRGTSCALCMMPWAQEIHNIDIFHWLFWTILHTDILLR